LYPAISRVCGDLVALNHTHRDNMAGLLGLVITAVGPDWVRGTLPVDERTVQPMGLLHGGASAVLAETLGSVASWLLVAGSPGARVAGIEISTSHIRAVREGVVTGVCRPLRLGRTLHFWNIDIFDEQGRQTAAARLTVSVRVPDGDGTNG
jgi:1,4-dihydroxy-2-naphthoyl-CoA hydrolase